MLVRKFKNKYIDSNPAFADAAAPQGTTSGRQAAVIKKRNNFFANPYGTPAQRRNFGSIPGGESRNASVQVRGIEQLPQLVTSGSTEELPVGLPELFKDPNTQKAAHT